MYMKLLVGVLVKENVEVIIFTTYFLFVAPYFHCTRCSTFMLL